MLKHCLVRLGPILVSAFSLLISSFFVQFLLSWYDPTFYLLANKGVGKIIFTLLVMGNLSILVLLQTPSFRRQWLETNFYFFRHQQWLLSYLKFFILFFILHWVLLIFFCFLGIAHYNPVLTIKTSTLLGILFGFIVTFFLAWTEELFFRGTIYPFFAQFWSPLVSIVSSSFIFMIAHSLTEPLKLLTTEWKLGLGLFLLGILLNLFFALTNRLYVGMGAHAGLVFVKVILRRIQLIKFLPSEQIPYWANIDLRQSLLVHALFFVLILILIKRYKKQLLLTPNNKNV